MARHESDREDLFAEATALVRRAELSGPGHAAPVTFGFRKDGGWSVYFGDDPAYHFDGDSRLKRAFHSGRLYRTQGHTLAELVRERTPNSTLLHRRDLLVAEVNVFHSEMVGRITNLVVQVSQSVAAITRQTPPDDHMLWSDFERAVRAMNAHQGCSAALAPCFKGKR